MCPGPGPSAHTHTHKTRADQADIAACRQTAHLHLHAERVKVGIWLIDVNCMHQLHRWWKWMTWMAEIGTRTRVIRVKIILRSAIQRTKWLHWFRFFDSRNLICKAMLRSRLAVCSVHARIPSSFQSQVHIDYCGFQCMYNSAANTHTHMSNTWQIVAIYIYICI